MDDTTDTALWPPNDCASVGLWLNARSDGECTPAQEGWLAAHLQTCSGCSREWAALEKTRLAFETARLREPADFEVEALRKALAPTLLQDAGWALIVLGAALLGGYGAWELWTDSSTPVAARVGLGALGTGLLLVLARVAWERWRTRRVDPYRSVQR